MVKTFKLDRQVFEIWKHWKNIGIWNSNNFLKKYENLKTEEAFSILWT